MKKKVAILTIIDFNLGNRLQNYAVQEVFLRMNAEVHTIRCGGTFLGKIKSKLRDIIIKDRYFNFRSFDKNIIWSKYRFGDDFADRYDLFSVGSDQVWNANWYDNLPKRKNAFLLSFAESDKRISFSASFGSDKLPERWNPWFKEQLSLFKNISVREESGVDIVKELTGKNATLLIDPTLMLNVDEWMKVSKKPLTIKTDEPYILTYFLGGRTDRVNSDLKKYSHENNMTVYNLCDKSEIELYKCGPSEFLYLVANAKLVMTDSFHACVFSFLFKKPFLVYRREGMECDMFSRLETLLDKFDIKRKYIDSGLDNELFESDYDIGYQKLKNERKKVIDFLKKSMRISNED